MSFIMPFPPADRPVTPIIKPKERTYNNEYIVAAEELADFCYLSVEELFPDLAVSNSYRLYKEFKELEEAKKRGYIEANADSFLEYLKKEAFITVDQYARIYGAKADITDISDGEIGRYHGIRVIFTDYVAQDKALREMMARNARREKPVEETGFTNRYPEKFAVAVEDFTRVAGTSPKPSPVYTKLTGRQTLK